MIEKIAIMIFHFVKKCPPFYFDFGVIGIGMGLVWIPTLAIIPSYFVKRRALASGLVGAFGGSLGFVAFPLLVR